MIIVIQKVVEANYKAVALNAKHKKGLHQLLYQEMGCGNACMKGLLTVDYANNLLQFRPGHFQR